MSTAPYTFYYCGKTADGFTLRAPTWKTKNRKALDAVLFEGEVMDWLFENVGHNDWHLGNGNVAGYPDLPQAYRTGSSLCLLLKRPADLIRFEQTFPVSGLTPDALLEAA